MVATPANEVKGDLVVNVDVTQKATPFPSEFLPNGLNVQLIPLAASLFMALNAAVAVHETGNPQAALVALVANKLEAMRAKRIVSPDKSISVIATLSFYLFSGKPTVFPGLLVAAIGTVPDKV